MNYIRLALVLLLPLLVSCLGEVEPTVQQTELVKVGQELPAFTVELNDGSVFSSSAVQSKPLVIAFFNTACKDCQRELPVLQKVYESQGDRVAFLCISRAQGDSEVAAYWQQNALTLPYSAQTDRTVYNLFATSTIPRIYVADTSRVVRAAFKETMGQKALETALRSVVPDTTTAVSQQISKYHEKLK